MQLDQTGNARFTIQVGRGDSLPIVVNVTGDGLNIAGFTFRMTVNQLRDPGTGDAPLFQLAGIITNAGAGEVTFTPTSAQTNVPPGTYFYDVEMVQAARVQTVVKGRFLVMQDITK